MAIDRSKFKSTLVAKNEEKDKETAAAMGIKGGGARADQLKITDGRNLFRIYPPHPEDGGEVFAEPCARVFLPIYAQEKDADGNPQFEKGKPKMKEFSKPIFNSRMHGGTPKDLVEEYVNLAKKIAEDEFDINDQVSKNKKTLFLDKVCGRFSKTASERLPGLLYKTLYAMYVDKIEGTVKTFGKIEVGQFVKGELNKIAANEEEDDPLATDPFTDLEFGRAVVINYNSKAAKPGDYYSVQLDSQIDKQGRARFFPLTDEQLETFSKVPSLVKLFKNAFKRKDFENQLAGLEYFDSKYELGIFEREEFTAIIEEINEYYPEEGAEEKPKEELKKAAQPLAKKVEVKAAVAQIEEGEEELDDMNLDRKPLVEEREEDVYDSMNRTELIALKKENNLTVKIFTTDDEEMVRTKIREAMTPIPHVALPGENHTAEQIEEMQPPAFKKAGVGRLDSIRSKK